MGGVRVSERWQGTVASIQIGLGSGWLFSGSMSPTFRSTRLELSFESCDLGCLGGMGAARKVPTLVVRGLPWIQCGLGGRGWPLL